MAERFNVSYEVKGSKAVITVDLSGDALKKARLSSTGRTAVCASTGGQPLELAVGGKVFKGQVNVYSKDVVPVAKSA